MRHPVPVGGGGVLSIFGRRACAVFPGIVFTNFFWSRASKELKKDAYQARVFEHVNVFEPPSA